MRHAEVGVAVIEDGPLSVSACHAVHECGRGLHGRAQVDGETDHHRTWIV